MIILSEAVCGSVSITLTLVGMVVKQVLATLPCYYRIQINRIGKRKYEKKQKQKHLTHGYGIHKWLWKKSSILKISTNIIKLFVTLSNIGKMDIKAAHITH